MRSRKTSALAVRTLRFLMREGAFLEYISMMRDDWKYEGLPQDELKQRLLWLPDRYGNMPQEAVWRMYGHVNAIDIFSYDRLNEIALKWTAALDRLPDREKNGLQLNTVKEF